MKKFSILLLILLIGCVSAQVTMLQESQLTPISDPSKVQVFLSEADVKVPYDKIAIIHAKGESTWTNEKQMISAMRKKAAKIGANGIILQEIKEASDGAKVAAAVFGVSIL